jgi:subtilisin family serine protease
MKKLIFVIITTLSFFGIARGQSNNHFHQSRIIAKITKPDFIIKKDAVYHFQNHTELLRLNEINGLNEIRVLNPKHGKNLLTLHFQNELDIQKTIRAYKDLDIFEFVEPDFIGMGGGVATSIKPNDDFYFRQWSHYNDGTFNLYNAKAGADVKMEQAWEITQGSEDVSVAILDSGIRFTHDEFSGRIWQNNDEASGSVDMDGNGYVGDYRGWDFVNQDNDPTDDFGHGTNVAGILGASGNNAKGYAGADWNAKLMILKILDDTNSGYYSWWIEAIFYAIDNGADVVNMSVGGSGFSAGMKEAVEEAHANDIAVIVCMMNENNAVPFYPAAYDATIAIGSTNPDDTRSNSFPWDENKGSNYGNHIDLAAPGNYIFGLSYNSNSNYETYWSGTSQATPLVTGTVSLMLSLNSDLNPEEIRNILRMSADDEVGKTSEDISGWDRYHGAGRLNAYNAISNLNTGTDEIKLNDKFFIFGNPVTKSRSFYLGFNNSFEKKIKIFNVSGVLNFETSSTKNWIEINTSRFDAGFYFIQVNRRGKNYTTKKIIVH